MAWGIIWRTILFGIGYCSALGVIYGMLSVLIWGISGNVSENLIQENTMLFCMLGSVMGSIWGLIIGVMAGVLSSLITFRAILAGMGASRYHQFIVIGSVIMAAVVGLLLNAWFFAASSDWVNMGIQTLIAAVAFGHIGHLVFKWLVQQNVLEKA